MDKLGIIFENSKPDSTVLLAQQAALLSKTAQFPKGEAKSLNLEGGALRFLGSYPKALSCYLSALKINEQRGDQLDVAKNLANIGSVYSLQGDERCGYPQVL